MPSTALALQQAVGTNPYLSAGISGVGTLEVDAVDDAEPLEDAVEGVSNRAATSALSSGLILLSAPLDA
jgi:hypothetical protein